MRTMVIKRSICIALAFVMILVIAACAGDGGTAGGGGGNSGNNTGDVSRPGPGDGNTPTPTPGGGDSGGTGGTDTPSTPGGGDSGSGSGGGSSSTNLSGPPGDILAKLLADIAETGVELPMLPPPMEVMPDVSENTIGLNTADFERLVETAVHSMPLIGTFAHQFIVILAKSDSDAVTVKNLISGDGGYDPMKWICVWPEMVVAVESGPYVLLVASRHEVVEIALEAFAADAGKTGSVNTVYEFIP